MSVEPLECLDCGANWQSVPAAHASAANGGCLVCGGRLVPATADPDADDSERQGAGPDAARMTDN